MQGITLIFQTELKEIIQNVEFKLIYQIQMKKSNNKENEVTALKGYCP